MLPWPVVALLLLLAFALGYALGRRRSDRAVVWTATTPPVASPDVEALVRDGRKIDAIKRYRKLHGVGLKEAKDAVEALERELPPQS
jgi:phosphodiesterase/alkaline phosphatase D-like protein